MAVPLPSPLVPVATADVTPKTRTDYTNGMALFRVRAPVSDSQKQELWSWRRSASLQNDGEQASRSAGRVARHTSSPSSHHIITTASPQTLRCPAKRSKQVAFRLVRIALPLPPCLPPYLPPHLSPPPPHCPCLRVCLRACLCACLLHRPRTRLRSSLLFVLRSLRAACGDCFYFGGDWRFGWALEKERQKRNAGARPPVCGLGDD
jgi:hypothetical protein